MRRAVVVVSVVLSSLPFAESAFAQAKLAEVSARPESVSPGEPVRLSARLTEPAPAGGTEVTFNVCGGGNGQHPAGVQVRGSGRRDEREPGRVSPGEVPEHDGVLRSGRR